MRGKKAKAIAKIAEKYEPRTHKHAMRHYIVDKNGTLRIASGFTMLYRIFKQAYKRMDRDTMKNYMDMETKK